MCAGASSDLTAVHDVSGGGLAVALAEMACVAGVGVEIDVVTDYRELFSEFPGRFVVATTDPDALVGRAAAAGVSTTRLGSCEGARVRVGSLITLSLDELVVRGRDALARALEVNV